MKINVAYACNEAYMEQTTVSLVSLFENNKSIEEITVYFIDMGIEDNSIKDLESLVSSYGRDIHIISFQQIAYDLNAQSTGRHILSVYAKIFFGRIKGIDKILYLDSDVIVVDSLIPFWTIDMECCVCAGVETLHSEQDNTQMGLSSSERAINDGVVLMDLSLWRSGQYLERCLNYIKEHDGNPPVLSEGTINNVCRGAIKIIEPRYNLMSGIVNQKGSKLEKLTGRKYYSQELLENANAKPCIIHFLSGFYNRPWCKQCTHPMRELYLLYKGMTKWADAPLSEKRLSKRIRMIGFLYKILPTTLFVTLRRVFG